jgi:hypothetical protein
MASASKSIPFAVPTQPVPAKNSKTLVKVTQAEKRKFLKLAKSRHVTLSELVSQLLHRELESRTRRAGCRKW